MSTEKALPTKPCPSCKSEIHADAKKCPNCRTNLQSWPRRHPILAALVFIFVVLPVSISTFGSFYRASKGTETASNSAQAVVTSPEALKASLKAELEQIKSFDGEAMRKTQENGDQSEELNTFERWGSLVQEGKKSPDKETVDLAKELERKASVIQTKEFPLMRKITADRLKTRLWSKNIEVSVSGSKNEVIEFVGIMFADNQNILDFYAPSMGDMERLRFRSSRFRWSKGADGTEFDHTKTEGYPKDGDVVPRSQ